MPNADWNFGSDIDSVLQTAFDAGVLTERRQHPRRRCGLCITAVPTDESGNAIGPLRVGHCIDVSDGGIRITLSQPLTSRYLRVEPIIASSVFGFKSAILEVLRRGYEDRCYVYAGRFTKPLS